MLHTLSVIRKRIERNASYGLVVVAIVTMILACDAPVEENGPGYDAAAEQVRLSIENLLPAFDEALQGFVETSLFREQTARFLEGELPRPFRHRVHDGLRYADLHDRLYSERKYRSVYTNDGRLTPKAQAALTVIANAHEHGLDPVLFQLDRIRELEQLIDQALLQLTAWRDIELTANEFEEMVVWANDVPSLTQPADGESFIENLFVAVVDEGGEGTAFGDRIAESVNEYRVNYKTLATLTAELELRTADAVFRYARDLKHFNMSRYSWKELREKGGTANIIYERLEVIFHSIIEARSEQDIVDLMNGLAPQHEQYGRLFRILKTYRNMAREGEWPMVRRHDLILGQRSSHTKNLRERLTRQGYLEQEQENIDIVDGELIDALKQFQSHHQLPVNGTLTRATVRQLNISLNRRIAQIELTMRRWQESSYANEPDYILVNIPDFHAEVYADNERAMRFRVVVGKANRVCDTDTKKWKYPNATPVQMALMDHIMLNPAWYVPTRLVEEVIMPKVARNEEWAEENGYEQITLDNGRTAWRQLPGDNNALGRVKFIFPNPHNTYMHDTPQKQLFEYESRAFSFGCMRVQYPVALAKYLVEWDGQSEHFDVDSILESARTVRVNMKRELPVFTEYFSVRVDEHGQVHFLGDIYDDDARRLSDDPEAFDACTIPHRVMTETQTTQVTINDDISVDLSNDLGP